MIFKEFRPDFGEESVADQRQPGAVSSAQAMQAIDL
jgi:hypothetical protein